MRSSVITIILSTLLLSACGGGGGGSTSDTPVSSAPTPTPDPAPTPTPDPAPTPVPDPNGTVFDNYTGQLTHAEVSNTTAYSLVLDITTALDMGNILMSGAENNSNRFDSFLPSGQGIVLGEDESCESGSLELGELNEEELTADFSYVDCTVANYTIGGVGLLQIETVNLWGFPETYYLYFDALVVDNGRNSYTLSGRIYLQNYADSVHAFFNTLVVNNQSEEQFYLRDLRYDLFDNGTTSNFSVDGRLYMSEQGYVDIDTYRPGQGLGFGLVADGSATLDIDLSSEGDISLGLFAENQMASVPTVSFPYRDFIDGSFESATNQLPVAEAVFEHTSLERNTRIDLVGSMSSDPNSEDLLSYQWTILSQPSASGAQIQNNGFVDAYIIFDAPGTYNLSLEVSDGELTSAPLFFDFTVLSNAPDLNWAAGTPTQIMQGDSFVAQVELNDEIDGHPYYAIHYGPVGMTVDQNGQVTWDGDLIRLGENTSVRYAVIAKNEDRETILTNEVLVLDSTDQDLQITNLYPLEYGLIVDDLVTNSAVQLTFDNDLLSLVDVESGAITREIQLPSNKTNHWVYNSLSNEVFFINFANNQVHSISLEEDSDILEYGPVFRNSTPIAYQKLNDQLVAYGPNGYVNTSSGESEFYPQARGVTLAGDITGDGTLELVARNGIFKTSNMVRLTDSVDTGIGSQVQLVDVDSDAKQEIVVYQSRSSEQIEDRVSIYRLDDNNSMELVQSVSTGADFENYAFSDDGQTLYLIGETLSQFSRGSDGLFTHVQTQSINSTMVQDLGYDAFRNCEVQKLFNQQIYVQCNRPSSFSTVPVFEGRINLTGSTPVLSLRHVTPEPSMGILDLVGKDEHRFALTETEILEVTDSRHVIRRQLSQQVGQLNTRLAFIDDQLYVLQNSGRTLTSSVVELSDTASFTEVASTSYEEFVPVQSRGQELLIVSTSSGWEVLNNGTLAQIASLEGVTDEVPFQGALLDADAFQFQGRDYLVLWTETQIVVFNHDNSGVSLYKRILTPENSAFRGMAFAALVLENDVEFVILDRARLVGRFMNSEEVVETDISLPSDRPVNCIVSNASGSRKVAYAVRHLDPGGSNNVPRIPKLVALDMASGELVWESPDLEFDFTQNSVGSSIACPAGLPLKHMTFATSQFLYQTH